MRTPTPWSHQSQAIEMAKGRDSLAIFFEQGTGKTFTLLQILVHLFQKEGRKLRTLILCPQIVIENWKREILSYTDIPAKEVRMLTGSQASRAFDVECDLGALGEVRHIYITNYESLNMKVLFERLTKWKPEVLALDESHKCKDLGAKRTQRAIELGDLAKYRYILSGTPITNSAFDIFSQFRFLDRGELFGKTMREFKERYFVDYNARRPRQSYFPNWQPRHGALEKINYLMYTKAIRAKKSECLDLPPFVRQKVFVDLSKEQQHSYLTMEKEAVLEFQKETISADLAITKCMKLQQIVTGFINDSEGKPLSFRPNLRLQALEEVISQIPSHEKFIIWAVFKQNYVDIRGLLYKLRIPFLEVHGEKNAKEKQEAIDSFNRRGSIRTLVCNQASAGTGANLTQASYSIFYSRNFNWEHDNQAEARNYRGGSEIHEKITRIDLVSPETIDEVVLQALAKKTDVSETILAYMKGKIK